MRNVQGLVGGALALVALSLAPALAADQRTYTGGHIALELNGERLPISGVRGGNAVGVVSTAPGGNGVTVDKQITGVSYEDIVFAISPTSLPKDVTAALEGKPGAVDGAIDFTDFDYKSVRRLTFKGAMVTGVRFPALDGSSKDAAKVDVTLSPESTRVVDGKGEVVKGSVSTKQKTQLVSNFRVQLDNLPANRVATVSPIELKMKRAESAVGVQREPVKQPTGYEIPNITLSLSAADAPQWLKWHEDSVVAGKTMEKTMRVELLGPDLKTPTLTLELTGVGIVAVRPEQAEAGSDKVARTQVELYAEGLKLINPGSVATTATPVATEGSPAPTASKEPAAAAPTAPAATDAPAQPEGARITRAQRERLRARAAEGETAPAPAK